MGTEFVVIIWFGTYAEESYVCVCVDLFRCNFEIGRAANFTSISSWRKVFQWSGFVSFPQMDVAGFFPLPGRLLRSLPHLAPNQRFIMWSVNGVGMDT